MGADQNFFRNQSVGLYPKITTSPQEFQVKFGIAMEELNQHKTPLERARENTEANEKIYRSGRLGPVRPLYPTSQTGRAGVQKPRPVRPVSETGQTGCTQTDRKQSFKRQILSKRSPNPTKLGGQLRIYPVNISPKDHSQKINRSREIKGRSKRIGVFSRTQKL